MKEVIIHIDHEDKEQRLGVLYVRDDQGCIIFKAESLERSYKDNRKNVSGIPLGTYPLMLEWSNRFRKDLWEIYNVPNRSECKIHSANYWFQLNGCIALGRNRKDINKDGFADVTSSRQTMALFHKAMAGISVSRITIVKVFNT